MTTKISIVFLFAMFIGVLSAPFSNIIITNGFTITTNNETIICDKLTCPDEAKRCVITSNTDDTNENIITTWQCIGENDKVLIEEQSTDKNPNKNSVNVHIESGPGAEAFWKETTVKLEKQFEEFQKYFSEFWKNFDPFGNNNKE